MEDTSKRIVRSSFMRVTDLVSGIVVSFFFMPFLVHTLGDDWYGIWTVIGSLTGTYYLLDFGLASAVTRYVTYSIARNEADGANTVINTSLAIYSGLALLVLGVTLVAAYVAVPPLVSSELVRPVQLAFVLVGTTLAAEFPFKAFAGIVGAYMRYDLLSLSHIGVRVVSIGLSVALLSQGYGIVALAIVGFAASVLQNVVFVWLAKHLFPDLRLNREMVSGTQAKDLFAYSSWSFLISIANIVRTRVDAALIGGILTAAHVTHYFIGARLADLVFTLLLRATNLGMPILTRYHSEQNYDAARRAILLMTKVNVVVGVLAVGIVLLVGGAFIERWMGAEYAIAYPIAMILLVAFLVQLVTNPLDNALYAISKHRMLAIIAVGEAVANVGLSIVLLVRYGLLGAAIGTAVPLIVTRILLLPRYACREIGLSLGRFAASVARAAIYPAFYFLVAFLLAGQVEAGTGYLHILIYVSALAPPYLFVTYRMVFSRQERDFLAAAFLKAVGRGNAPESVPSEPSGRKPRAWEPRVRKPEGTLQ